MTTIRRHLLKAAILAAKGIQSTTWTREGDKKVKGVVVAEAGDIVSMQFIPKINPNGTKGWTPKGGNCFNSPNADEIRKRRNLLTVTKMSETGTNDPRATIRNIPLNKVTIWQANGVLTYVVD